MFFVLSDSSLVGIYLGVVREDCGIDLHIDLQNTPISQRVPYVKVFLSETSFPWSLTTFLAPGNLDVPPTLNLKVLTNLGGSFLLQSPTSLESNHFKLSDLAQLSTLQRLIFENNGKWVLLFWTIKCQMSNVKCLFIVVMHLATSS